MFRPLTSTTRPFFSRPAHAVLMLIALTLMVSSCTPTRTIDIDPALLEYPVSPLSDVNTPSPDPRVGLEAGLFDAEEAIWNLNKLSHTVPPTNFVGVTNSDLAFKDNYVIQGNYNGFMVWDISNPATPELVVDYLCPASQSDVSVYGNLLFVSGEGLEGRLDCGIQGVEETVSDDRLRGIRIFDISDIQNPENIANVQTCRGSHTHSVLVDPDDSENIYVYVSGSYVVRPEEELAGCSDALPEEDPSTALFRIEIIQVPLANPEAAAIVNSPRIFDDLTAPPTHGLAPADSIMVEEMRVAGQVVVVIDGNILNVPESFINNVATQVASQRGAELPTEEDVDYVLENIDAIVAERVQAAGPGFGPTQCHDITLYPAIGLAGGACEGYGFLLDISDPVNPIRVDAVADSNFAYWHSATFNNDGTKVLFTDEWGGGGQPKCRATDPYEWGANAIFTIGEDREMNFESYYKLSAAQTVAENCVAHNGSLIPVPGRDIMVQSWYQGGISIFDWTDPANPVEIAFQDRGPVTDERMEMGGSWSVYWYNGVLVSSEIARGLDIFELEASPWLTQNEIDAARTVRLDYLNAQGQPQFSWEPSFTLAHAYLDQIERDGTMSEEEITDIRRQLYQAEYSNNRGRRDILQTVANELGSVADGSASEEKIRMLINTSLSLI